MPDQHITPRVLVIIPAYNEHESILATVNKIKSFGYDYVVVNDGSKDDCFRKWCAHRYLGYDP